MTLAEFVRQAGRDPDKAMDELQENGVVADECVLLQDVAPADQDRAIDFLTFGK